MRISVGDAIDAIVIAGVLRGAPCQWVFHPFPENRARFNLETVDHLRTGAPYWRRRSMSSVEMGNHLRDLHRAILSEGISLNAALYHHRLLDYRAGERATLLEEQRTISRSSTTTSWLFDRLNSFVDKRLANDQTVVTCEAAEFFVGRSFWLDIRNES